MVHTIVFGIDPNFKRSILAIVLVIRQNFLSLKVNLPYFVKQDYNSSMRKTDYTTAVKARLAENTMITTWNILMKCFVIHRYKIVLKEELKPFTRTYLKRRLFNR